MKSTNFEFSLHIAKNAKVRNAKLQKLLYKETEAAQASTRAALAVLERLVQLTASTRYA